MAKQFGENGVILEIEVVTGMYINIQSFPKRKPYSHLT